MLIQAFVDDSGGKGHSDHFFLAALVAEADAWTAFSTDWKSVLEAPPAIHRFKMSEAAARAGAFSRFSVHARDKKLRALANVINRYVKFLVWSGVKLADHDDDWRRQHAHKDMGDVYFWPFQTLIMGTCLDLWDHGVRQPFEILFDEQRIFGPRATRWYPMTQASVRHLYPDSASILPDAPKFGTDDDWLPLQAADLFWCIRRGTDNPAKQEFDWLLAEMQNVKQSDYCYFIDAERMQTVTRKRDDFLKSDVITRDLLDEYISISKKRP
jgi:hypothetical protein